MAWPERIVLIIFSAFAVLATEIAILVACKVIHAPGWFAAVYFLAAVFGDLWAALRLIDWLRAGPARRAGARIVRFSP